MQQQYDVVICGGSFSGLTLAKHLPKHLKVLLLDRKPFIGISVESTGLVTEHTRQIFSSFFDIDRYITNPITGICVVASDFKEHFISETDHNWIYQTDTRALVKAMAESLPVNVDVAVGCLLDSYEQTQEKITIRLKVKGEEKTIIAKFLVGADGGHSVIAGKSPHLSKHSRYLLGLEQVYLGDVHLGAEPAKTIYHFWFGEFSLGYGGWLSPTIVDGKKAFRLGLAKVVGTDVQQSAALLKAFVQKLLDQKIITIASEQKKPVYAFGGEIPVSGPLTNIVYENTMLIGDAAGFCGAFAADGIKGAIVSGVEGAKLIDDYFQGKRIDSLDLQRRVNSYNQLMNYYHKQLRYRWIWDQMKKNSTFDAMFKVIQSEKNNFLQQFCDSKDKKNSLVWTVLKLRNCLKLARYSLLVLRDMLFF